MAEPKQVVTTKQKVGGSAAIAAAIIAAVVSVEGGYVNNPKDPGGETNHGITKAVAVQHGYTGPMKSMPQQTAEEIYHQDYITKPGFEPFVAISPAVAHKLVDAGVNAGTARPSRWLQISLNALNRDGKDYPDIIVDGKISQKTVDAYLSLTKRRGSLKACQLTLKLLDAQQAAHYLSLTKLETFTPGWIDNRIGNVPISECR